MSEVQRTSKVVKFGGSSLADANQFQKVKAIITAEPERRYVVPSAPGKRFANDIKINAQSPVNVGACDGATADNAYDCHKAGGTWTPDATVFTSNWTPIGDTDANKAFSATAASM